MAILGEFDTILSGFSAGERAQILAWMVRDLKGAATGIDSRPDVCGGQPCIVRTRIPVWILEQARSLGMSEHELLAGYHTLRTEDVVNAGAYVRVHRTEIDAQISDNEAAWLPRFYSNENIALHMVRELRELGHDVLTSLETGNAKSAIPDVDVLTFATNQNPIRL